MGRSESTDYGILWRGRPGLLTAALALCLALPACDKPITDADYWTLESTRKRAGCEATGYCDKQVICPAGKRQVGPAYSCSPLPESERPAE